MASPLPGAREKGEAGAGGRFRAGGGGAQCEGSGRLLDAVAQREDGLEGLPRGLAVVPHFGLRQLVVGDKVGVFFGGVVARRPVGPAPAETLPGPDVVGVLGQLKDGGVPFYLGGIDRLRLVTQGWSLLARPPERFSGP